MNVVSFRGSGAAVADTLDERSVAALRRRYGDANVDVQLQALRAHGDAVEDPELWLRTALERRFKFMPIALVRSCPCGCRESRLVCRFVFWNLLGVRECSSCGLLFVSPRITPSGLRRIFSETFFDYSDLEFWGARRSPVFEEAYRALVAHGCSRIFDVGAAFGHFVKLAGDRGLKAAGSDLSDRAVAIGRERLGVQLQAGVLPELHLPPASVDAVVSLDTLYYAQDPLAELRAMRQLVRPGGWLVLRLRNGIWSRVLAWMARTGWRRGMRPVMPAEHLWSFTPGTARRFLELAGWRQEEYSAAAFSRSRFGPLYRAALVVNRGLRRIWPGFPILTTSFNVVARRED
jgi:SAM-dependent methyltransferase